MAVGLALAAALVLMGVLTGVRQRATLRRVHEEPFLPGDDRRYLRSQAHRRLVTSGVLVLLGGMIGFAYLSGMEARADRIAAKAHQPPQADPADDPGRPAEQPPVNDEDRQFVKWWGAFWIAVLVLVFVVGCLAVFDFWATRKYWMARFKEIKDDHQTKLQRDLAVHRQAKLNDRMKGRRRPPDDTDPEGPTAD